MKLLLWCGGGALIIGVAWAWQFGGAREIHCTDEGFAPTNLSVSVGDEVVFRNNSSRPCWPASDSHPTHEVYSDFDPRHSLKPGELWKFQFQKKGIWDFHDHLAPYAEGRIEVRS